MKKILKKPFSKWEIVLYVFFLLFCGGIALVSAQTNEKPSSPSVPQNPSNNQKSLQTITSKASPAFSSQKFLGTITSNANTMIHSRREGLIKDLFVDVGDSVTQGQKLASLFAPGVEGQSHARIQKALADLAAAENELQKIQSVAQESKDLAQQNLAQTRTKLENLANAKNTRSKIQQQADNIQTEILQIGEKIRWILFGDQESNLNSQSIIGNFNDERQKNKVVNALKDFQSTQKKLENLLSNGDIDSIFKLLKIGNILLTETEKLYQKARESSFHTQEMITKHLAQIHQYQITVLQLQNTFDSLLLSVRDTQEEIQQKQSSLSLTESQNQRVIEQAQKKVDIAKASYQIELSTSGNNTIVAPFSGVITDRFIEVGQAVGMKNPLFMLENSKTGLSHQGYEVVFEIPQSAKNEIKKGKSITVTAPYYDEDTTAIIKRIETNINAKTNTFSVFAQIQDEAFPKTNGEKIFVTLQNGENSVWIVPSTALKRRGLEYFVWTESEGQLYHIPVTVLAEDGEYSDLRGPLTPDMEIIQYASASLWRDSQSFSNHSES